MIERGKTATTGKNELRADKDTTRHDTLVMDVTKDRNGNLVALYKVALL